MYLIVQNDGNEAYICPLQLDMYCNNEMETALHAAVKSQDYDIVLMLLQSGANPNLMIQADHDINEVSPIFTRYIL